MNYASVCMMGCSPHCQKIFTRVTLSILSHEHEQLEHLKHAILQRIAEMETKIMSALSDELTQINNNITSVNASLDGINTGIAALDALITQLQNSPGTLNPTDQTALDAIQAASNDLVKKASAVVTVPPVTPAAVAAAKKA